MSESGLSLVSNKKQAYILKNKKSKEKEKENNFI